MPDIPFDPDDPTRQTPALTPTGRAQDTGDSDIGSARASRRGLRRWLRPKPIAAVVLVLLAAEIGYVVHVNMSSAASQKAPPPLLTEPTVSRTTVPRHTVTTVSRPTSTLPHVTTTVPLPATTTSQPPPATSTTAVAVQPCTTADLTIVTSTDRSSYAAGQTVNLTTTLTDKVTCSFQPTPTAPYSCASSLVVSSSAGTQVWPPAGQSEQCSPPPAETLTPGIADRLSSTWESPTAGTYQAVGTWGWSPGSGQPPTTAHVASPAFTVG